MRRAMTWPRRLGAVLLLAFSLVAEAGERVIDGATGASLSFDEAFARLRAAERVLLGEYHDNPRHHELRGNLIATLKPAVVVAEHLDRGRQVDFGTDTVTHDRRDDSLLQTLDAAGFDAKAWRWPLMQPLFAGIASARSRLVGGNMPRALVRRIALHGDDAVPGDFRRALSDAPLSDSGRDRLDAGLVQGHCNMLDATHLPGMRVAQRVRDAAMAATLAAQPAPAPGAPLVLVAGNGHVRRDHGVPVLLRAARLAHVTVGFVESEEELAEARRDGLYDIVWVTKPAVRPDPCAALR